ncbi:uncharacterized protein LOC141674495 [Apium graveolens]|uniref:uncharacterized protein LOC141674495 n=1 Tax=Apium graveolens TaxID=4045 RepID=UPI003D7BE489
MNTVDIPKTAFITPKGTYAYIKMPFGLKNTGATFQRMVNKVFNEQISRNMERYVDDMIVKLLFRDHAEDLRECFKTLRRNNMKINPRKCTFRVASGKFPGYLVSERGIEANAEKIKEIVDIEPSKCIRDIQKLTCRMAALLHFISRLAERALFAVLKGLKAFEWGPKCQEAFEKAIRFIFPLTNNEAEYEALLVGMNLERNLEAKHLKVFSDSMPVLKHFSGEYEQRDPRTRDYAAKLKELSMSFQSFELIQVARENNSRANALSCLASTETQSLTGSIYLSEVRTLSIDKKLCMEIHQEITWMMPIMAFLEKRMLPLSKKEAQKVRYRAASYTIINGKLYRRSASSTLLQCLDMEEQKLALETVPDGICGEHLARRHLAFKIL